MLPYGVENPSGPGKAWLLRQVVGYVLDVYVRWIRIEKVNLNTAGGENQSLFPHELAPFRSVNINQY